MAIRARRRYAGDGAAGVWAFLTDQPMPEQDGTDRDDYIGLEFFGNVVRGGPRDLVRIGEVWASHRGTVLGEWPDARPGTRPRCWWRFDAPVEAQRRREVGEDETEILDDLGLLTIGERAALGLL